jgi:hypothetical protein
MRKNLVLVLIVCTGVALAALLALGACGNFSDEHSAPAPSPSLVVQYERTGGLQGGISDSLRIIGGTAAASQPAPAAGGAVVVSDATMAALLNAIDKAGFYKWNSSPAPPGVADLFEYHLSIQAATNSHAVTVYDSAGQAASVQKILDLVRKMRQIVASANPKVGSGRP